MSPLIVRRRSVPPDRAAGCAGERPVAYVARRAPLTAADVREHNARVGDAPGWALCAVGQSNVTVYAVGADATERPIVHHVAWSPGGLEYGYGGAGPTDLARSLWIDYCALGGPPHVNRDQRTAAIQAAAVAAAMGDRGGPPGYSRFGEQFIDSADHRAPQLRIPIEEIDDWTVEHWPHDRLASAQ